MRSIAAGMAIALVCTGCNGSSNGGSATSGALIGLHSLGVNAGWELREMAPLTGSSTLMGSLTGADGVGYGISALDPLSGHIYQVGLQGSGDALITLDAATGQVVRVVPLDIRVASIEVDPLGHVLGLHWNGSEEELRAIDPVTGASTVISVVPELNWLRPGMSTADLGAGIYYQLGTEATDKGIRLFAIDMLTGALLHSPRLDADVVNIEVDGDGRVLGFFWTGTREELREVNPQTGATTFIADIPGMELLEPGVSALDPVAGTIYQTGSSWADSELRLFTLDTTTGALLGSPVMDSRMLNMEVVLGP
ncbi:hypothetical protein [Chondromyces crocatus]|uniref:DUF4394 domain-containing protein n=1 Tax=Chondromyces crocatus TaxID=52 RepID=A0A0K1E9P5_CHOCO|nr:hypothetical protein [Chondromyces crocatus]AKT37559.1 uncharacterized protein CMC5_017000 [Chondromyces crocatus]